MGARFISVQAKLPACGNQAAGERVFRPTATNDVSPAAAARLTCADVAGLLAAFEAIRLVEQDVRPLPQKPWPVEHEGHLEAEIVNRKHGPEIAQELCGIDSAEAQRESGVHRVGGTGAFSHKAGSGQRLTRGQIHNVRHKVLAPECSHDVRAWYALAGQCGKILKRGLNRIAAGSANPNEGRRRCALKTSDYNALLQRVIRSALTGSPRLG